MHMNDCGALKLSYLVSLEPSRMLQIYSSLMDCKIEGILF